MNGLESQVPRSALSHMVTRHAFIRGLHVLCMWSYYTVRSVHCAQGAMGNGASALVLLVKQGSTADAVLWLNLLKIAMYKRMAGSSLKWCIFGAVIDHARD